MKINIEKIKSISKLTIKIIFWIAVILLADWYFRTSAEFNDFGAQCDEYYNRCSSCHEKGTPY